MAVAQRRLTLEEFLALPEGEPPLELEPDGTVDQKVSPQGQHSGLQPDLAQLFNSFGRPRKLARAFTELRATYAGASFVSDVSVYQWARIPRTADGKLANTFREPPDIAVEIISPDQRVTALVRRCLWYVGHGVRVALLVDPADESVLLFRAGREPRALRGADEIDVSDVLPGFRLTVGEVFASLRMD